MFDLLDLNDYFIDKKHSLRFQVKNACVILLKVSKNWQNY